MASHDSLPLIIDSHMHLYPASELNTLAWLTPNTGSPLDGQHSVSDYLKRVSPPSGIRFRSSLRGFVFIETDRKHDLATQDFECPLMEVSWVSRVAQGLPRPGEGHSASDAQLVLGMIPWAPLPLGPEVVDKYIARVLEAAGPSAPLIRGFRYLVQGKPPNTMLSTQFISSLRRLGEQGYVCDVGVCLHQQPYQGPELISMIQAAHSGVPSKDKVVFIINHIAKPDMTNTEHLIAGEYPAEFVSWKHTIEELARFENVYIKLSGCFSEMTAEFLRLKGHDEEELFAAIEPFLGVVLRAFGPERCMFGSDWPVCEANPLAGETWRTWQGVISRMCQRSLSENGEELTDEERKRIWHGTAVEAYGLKI